MKKMITSIILSMVCLGLGAPPFQSGWIVRQEPINLFERYWTATTQIESQNDSLAVNLNDPNGGSFGIAQIGWLKLDEYNQANGTNYKLTDLFSVELSKKIFFWHCSNFPDIETAVKRWNGSGSATLIYWDRILAEL
jgi:hypothetical protein